VPSAQASAPNFDLDRINVNGGRAGTQAPPVYLDISVSFPAFDGVQRGVTGKGGEGKTGNGGNAGTVGGGVVGGEGGTIDVTAAGSIRTVQDYADGGSGGDQAGKGGSGGQAKLKGGDGGSVGGAGNGGNAGQTSIEAQSGIALKEEAAFGGNGGNVTNFAIAGNGGDGRTAGTGGNLGNVDGAADITESSNGGAGGRLKVENQMDNNTILATTSEAMNFDGGNGGSMEGTAGKGGDGTVVARFQSKGGNGGSCSESGAGGQGGAMSFNSPGDLGSVELMGGASVNGGDSGLYSATSGGGGSSTLNQPGGDGGDSGGQGDAGGSLGGIPVIMNITIRAGKFTLPAAASLTANGGSALSYINTPGNGGAGGGTGGNGGKGGHTGSGGDGGTIFIATTQDMAINGTLSASGGARSVMSVTSGNGGNAGEKGGGGNGGDIQPAGSVRPPHEEIRQHQRDGDVGRPDAQVGEDMKPSMQRGPVAAVPSGGEARRVEELFHQAQEINSPLGADRRRLKRERRL
jgi:hypothetical protein